jgi:two-component system chemotaxis response regulator CheV
MSDLLKNIDARTKLAGTNKLEILLFSLGTGEVFGINVFKVREVCPTPPVTRTPNTKYGVEGVISLRGNIIPVISLAKFIDIDEVPADSGKTMIVTEFSRHTQGFLVHSVDRIIRVDWDKVKQPTSMLTCGEASITAITEMPDGKLVSILDVEHVLVKAIGEEDMPPLDKIDQQREHTVFFADDSMVARKEITGVLESIGVAYQQATNGLDAWEKLQSIASRAEVEGVALKNKLSLILADAEMPEMDGYVLTKQIKSDRRFDGIPVVMHSSLSSEANRAMGQSVGVDNYVAKFDPVVLSDTIRPLLK